MSEDQPRVQLLPLDVLAAVLRRLAPRGLAVSRCVCRRWRATIDARRMLRGDLLPAAVGGIFVSLSRGPRPPEFFARPSAAASSCSSTGAPRPRIASRLQSYVGMDRGWLGVPRILRCCNGLLLLDGRVVNPATQQWVHLPPAPPGLCDDGFGSSDAYLAFDPMASPHYEVLAVDDAFAYKRDEPLPEGSEWPPSPYSMHVYSSRTGVWETRPFDREAAGRDQELVTIADVRSASELAYHHAVYWGEAIYAHCRGDFIMRITLSNNTYQVIKLPVGISASVYDEVYLGKSKSGVYFAVVDNDEHLLKVMFLSECGGGMEWTLKCDIDLKPLLSHFRRNPDLKTGRPWTLQEDGNCIHKVSRKGETVVEENLQWDSDDDNVLDIDEDKGERDSMGYVTIFGFHPYKEVVFLFLSNDRVVAYHLNGSKVQDLGPLIVPYPGELIDTAFVYTPCSMSMELLC